MDFAQKLLLHCAMAVVAYDCNNFDASNAIVVQVALSHCAKVDDVSVDGCLNSIWSIRAKPGVAPIPDE